MGYSIIKSQRSTDFFDSLRNAKEHSRSDGCSCCASLFQNAVLVFQGQDSQDAFVDAGLRERSVRDGL